MKQFVILFGLTLAGLYICVSGDVRAGASNQNGQKGQKETTMTARGTFDVKATQQPQDDSAGGPFGRLFLDKKYNDDLNATSKGQMLGAFTAVEGAGAYVAFEQVTGTLNGKKGSFILQHKGTMRKGAYNINVTVVPDSGTDELAGITGAMTIIIEGGKHSYVFEYKFEGN
jgi:uncharacterized protein DUF3224